ncbi:MAG TPA: histidine kinase [Acidimicrobiales bacterium]|nr:histidine kinase [Acidimicrobiales bacterium]
MVSASSAQTAMVVPAPWERRRSLHVSPWLLFAAAVVLTAFGVLLHLLNRGTPNTRLYFDPVLPGMALAYTALGAFLVSRRAGGSVGWLFCAGTLLALGFFVEQYAVYSLLVEPGSLPGGTAMAWLATWISIPAYLSMWTLLPLLFPDGHCPSPGWRPVSWLSGAAIAVTTLLAALTGESLGTASAEPLVGNGAMARLAGNGRAGCVLVLGPLCVLGLVRRYRSAAGDERARLRWPARTAVIVAAVPPIATMASLVAGEPVPIGPYQLVGLIALMAFPVAVANSILKQNLYRLDVQLDTLVNRVLVYGSLTVVGIAGFLLVLALLEVLISGTHGFGLSLVTLVVVAPLATRLRAQLQSGVDRLLYKKRDYDYRVFAALSRSLRSSLGPDAVLPSIVETVASGLKLPYVAITVGHGNEVTASATHGEPGHGVVVMPLAHQGEKVGELMVAPRRPNESFDSVDRRLLGYLADQVGVAAYALCLTADLQRSRERLVTAREEERRRLRRDLHDGLQPALAGVTLGIEAVRNILGPQSAAEQLLDRLKTELEVAGGDVRRLVYDLRPPALDVLGLVGALRQQADRFALSPSGLEVIVEAPADLPSLPAAVEVAVFRICLEALENVRKHAMARTCVISLAVEEGSLRLDVSDDGVGLPETYRAGVGLVAMRERAAELRGTLSVNSSRDGGTQLRARLPLAQR